MCGIERIVPKNSLIFYEIGRSFLPRVRCGTFRGVWWQHKVCRDRRQAIAPYPETPGENPFPLVMNIQAIDTLITGTINRETVHSEPVYNDFISNHAPVCPGFVMLKLRCPSRCKLLVPANTISLKQVKRNGRFGVMSLQLLPASSDWNNLPLRLPT